MTCQGYVPKGEHDVGVEMCPEKLNVACGIVDVGAECEMVNAHMHEMFEVVQGRCCSTCLMWPGKVPRCKHAEGV